jgi:ubiquinone/menaquinone biosynthesis C-methylase UbiE
MSQVSPPDGATRYNGSLSPRSNSPQRIGCSTWDFEVADAEHLPFDDRAFTAVLCSNSFHHYPDPLQAVREMARVLAAGGRLVIGDACADLATARIADRVLRLVEPGHVRLYRSTELGSFLQRTGLSNVMLRRLSGGGFAIARGIAMGSS